MSTTIPVTTKPTTTKPSPTPSHTPSTNTQVPYTTQYILDDILTTYPDMSQNTLINLISSGIE